MDCGPYTMTDPLYCFRVHILQVKIPKLFASTTRNGFFLMRAVKTILCDLRDLNSESDEHLVDERTMQLYREVLRNWSAPDAAEFDLLRLPSIRYLVVIIYVFIIVVGTLGNGLVVFVAACGRTARPPLSAKGSQVRFTKKFFPKKL